MDSEFTVVLTCVLLCSTEVVVSSKGLRLSYFHNVSKFSLYTYFYRKNCDIITIFKIIFQIIR